MNSEIVIYIAFAIILFLIILIDYKEDKKIDLNETNKKIVELSILTGSFAELINKITKKKEKNKDDKQQEKRENGGTEPCEKT